MLPAPLPARKSSPKSCRLPPIPALPPGGAREGYYQGGGQGRQSRHHAGPRHPLRRADAPVLDRALYPTALEAVSGEKASLVTDDCSLFLNLAGLPVTLTAGDYANLKITTKEDLQKGEHHAYWSRI